MQQKRKRGCFCTRVFILLFVPLPLNFKITSMVLSYIWISFFLVAFIVAIGRLVFLGDTQVFPEIINSTFSASKTAFEIALGLTGVLSLWLGIMKIGEKGGLINFISLLLSPIFSKLFPDIPK